MEPEVARGLLDVLEERNARLGRPPTRPSALAAARRDPIPAVAEGLGRAIAEEAGPTMASERIAYAQQLEQALLRIFGG